MGVAAGAAFIIWRDHHLFQFRDIKSAVLHLLVLCFVMICSVQSGNMVRWSSIDRSIIAFGVLVRGKNSLYFDGMGFDCRAVLGPLFQAWWYHFVRALYCCTTTS